MTNLFQMLGLGGNQAQMPGMAGQDQTNPLQRLLAPEFALPMAAGLLGNQGNMSNFGQGFANAAPFMALQRQRQETQAQTSKTLAFLQDKAPDIAAAVESGALPPADGWKAYLDRQRHEKGQGYINAGGGNLFNSETGEWVSAPGGGSEGVAGLQPVWLQDEQGTPIIGQVTKDGRVIRSAIDPGLTPVSPYQKNFETQRGAAEGKAVGEAAGALPGASMTAQRVAQQVEDLKSDPYLDSMLGPINSRLPNLTQDAARVQGRLNQLQGGAFLEARQALKGGGAITDYEGNKAEAAYARLVQAQGPEDFRRALDEFNFYVQQGLAKLQAQAGTHRMGGGVPAPGPAGVGSIKQKYGLD